MIRFTWCARPPDDVAVGARVVLVDVRVAGAVEVDGGAAVERGAVRGVDDVLVRRRRARSRCRSASPARSPPGARNHTRSAVAPGRRSGSASRDVGDRLADRSVQLIHPAVGRASGEGAEARDRCALHRDQPAGLVDVGAQPVAEHPGAGDLLRPVDVGDPVDVGVLTDLHQGVEVGARRDRTRRGARARSRGRSDAADRPLGAVSDVRAATWSGVPVSGSMSMTASGRGSC